MYNVGVSELEELWGEDKDEDEEDGDDGEVEKEKEKEEGGSKGKKYTQCNFKICLTNDCNAIINFIIIISNINNI